MIEETKLRELSPFIDCSTSSPNPSAYCHADCDIIKVEYKRAHEKSPNSSISLHVRCRVCGHKFIQYIV